MIYFIKPFFPKHYQWGTEGHTDTYYWDLSDVDHGWNYCWDDDLKQHSNGREYF